ncbi:MAG: prepilin peptidase [Limosilactobacillus sp.]
MSAKLFAAIVAACLSSFVNLCAYRLGCGQFPWSPPRSYCPHCHHPLCWWQLIPVLGFVIQGGRCHFCRQPIPGYDTICELTCGLFAYVLATPALFHSFLIIMIIQTLLFITSCDYYYQYLYPLSLIGLFPLWTIVPHAAFPTSAAILASAGLLIILAFMAVYLKWLGGGDVMFIAVLLPACGLEATAVIILCACLTTLPFFFFHRQLPFLPALCLATLVEITLACA